MAEAAEAAVSPAVAVATGFNMCLKAVANAAAFFVVRGKICHMGQMLALRGVYEKLTIIAPLFQGFSDGFSA